MFAASWLRHRNYRSGAYDLGIFDQGAWLLSRGLPADVTVIGTSIWQDHFSPVILVAAALYRIVPTPLWLLLLQAGAVGLSVVPARRIAAANGLAPGPFSLASLAALPVTTAVLFDFHPSTLAVPAIMWAAVGVVERDTRLTVVAAVVVVLCRADLGIVLVGLAVAAQRRQRIVLAAVGLLSVPAGLLIQAVAGGHSFWELHYGHLGAGPVDAAMHPWRAVAELVSPSSLSTLVFWGVGGALLFVRSPRWVIAVVVAAMPILLSSWPGTEMAWFHYGAPIWPLVLAGSADGCRRLTAPHRQVALSALTVASIMSLAALVSFGPTFLQPHPNADDYRAAVSEIEGLEKELGRPVSVSADASLVPHVAHRRHVFVWPLPFKAADSPTPPSVNSQPAVNVDVVIVTDRPDWFRLAEQAGFSKTRCRCGDVLVLVRPESLSDEVT